MSHAGARAAVDAVAHLVDEVGSRLTALLGDDHGVYVGSELAAVHRALARIRAEGLARGPVFCEWGSGTGGVCGIAAMNGFVPYGIEIRGDLVESARALANDLGFHTVFAQGTFLLPGDEDLARTAHAHTRLTFGGGAWSALGIGPGDCDVVFAYPWPGEEHFIDEVFSRHASSGALLLTFHGFGRVLVQRKLADQRELKPLGWL
jgi:hypothetical protein